MSRSTLCLMAAVSTLALLPACTKEPPPPPPPPEIVVEEVAAPATAIAVLSGSEDSGVSATVSFTQTAAGVTIYAHVDGAAPGPHGLHLHEFGDCSAPDFSSAGGHYNPNAMPHAGPMDAEHHAGDFGNIEVGEDGTGHLELTSTMLSLGGEMDPVGHAVILHEKADDLVTQPTGAAGGRIACGVVEAGG